MVAASRTGPREERKHLDKRPPMLDEQLNYFLFGKVQNVAPHFLNDHDSGLQSLIQIRNVMEKRGLSTYPRSR